jgi:hypothetical protein
MKGVSGTIASSTRCRPIRISTTTSIEFMEGGSTALAGTFQVTRPDATLNNFNMLPGSGTSIQFQDVEVGTSSGNVTFTRLLPVFLRCLVDSIGLTSCFTTFTNVVITDFDGVTIAGGTLTANNILLNGIISYGTDAVVSISNFGADDSGFLGLICNVSDSGIGINCLTLSSGVITDVETSLEIATGTFNYNSIYVASPVNGAISGFPFYIVGAKGSAQTITGDVGPNTTNAIECRNGAMLQVNGATTINAAGAANAVRVGARGVKSWAQIAGDAAADVSDFGAATGPQGVVVRKTL